MFPYVIKYKNGEENIVVDAFSKRYALLTLQTKLLGFEFLKDMHALVEYEILFLNVFLGIIIDMMVSCFKKINYVCLCVCCMKC